MSTMFIQLRRVVYLLVLLQWCVCAAYAGSETAVPVKEEEVNCMDGVVIKDLDHLTEYSSTIYEPLLKQAGKPLEAADDCLLTWRYDVNVCNESITRIADVVNTTVHFLYGVKKSKKPKVESLKEEKYRWLGLLSRAVGVELPDPQPIECGDPRVKEFMDNINKTVGEFNETVNNVSELVRNARVSRYFCGTHRQGLEFELEKWKRAVVDWFLDIAKKNSSKVCMNDTTREGVAKVVTTYNRIVTALDDISNASAGTQVCRVNAGVNWGKDLEELLGFLKDECRETYGEMLMPNVEKKEVAKEKDVRGVLKPETTSTHTGDSETGSRAQFIKGFNESTEKAKQRKIEEARRREEAERAAVEARIAAEERARKEEEAKKAAEEKARKEEEAKRVADEKARKEEEAKKAAEKARKEEEKARKVAERAAKEDEAKRAAAEKTKKKKDGSSSPALAHTSILLLVLLCVLGCSLMC
ncbi:uncharacterized protein TM35_000173280 [Trypanosoma theileri]|uniref:Uncharacterized protein n=1 Tax=Trypanosoma theileri TaxID=67003 RepID=A0A1X0NUS3_9TRYP|nr:uncharacterized protein TM35_000173280 [Trypanosoma theileri]ORC88456.1 hypothetical protein TM35_000173280 [Trypanosoma theileri]